MSADPLTPHMMTAAGLSHTLGANSAIQFYEVSLKLVDGAPVTANHIWFFNTTSAAGYMFESTRTDAAGLSLSDWHFSGTLGATGRYIYNSGSAVLTFWDSVLAAGNWVLGTNFGPDNVKVLFRVS